MLNRTAGYSLISMMISLALGLTFLSSALTVISAVKVSQQVYLDTMVLEDEMYRLAFVIQQGVAQSGQQGKVLFTLLAGEPDITFAALFAVSHHPNETINSCILFATDDNRNGKLDTQPINEEQGFRLRDNALEVRTAGRSCRQSGWQDISDTARVHINEFAVTIEGESTLTFFLSASLVNSPAISRQLQFTTYVQHGIH